MSRTLCIALALLPVLAAPQALAQKPDPDLRREAEAILQRWKVPGAGLALVQRSGVVWADGIGLADRRRGAPVTADTMFRTGSISKSFVSAVLLQLAEQGKVRLEDRLATLCPDVEFSNAWEATDPVRLVHLLEHTTGFDDMRFNEWHNPGDPDVPLVEMLALNPRSRVSRWRPGTMPSYSNVGYGVAGHVVERLTRQRFEDAIRDRLLEPLGMKSSSFRLTDEVKRRLATGYTLEGKMAVPYQHIYHRPAGSLHSSPRELGRFVQMLLNRGRADGRQLLRPESIDRMEVARTTSASRAGLRASYGLGNYFDVNQEVTTHGHEGGIEGFLSSYAYVPERGVGYVVLINASHSGEALMELKSLMLRHALKLAEETTASTPALHRSGGSAGAPEAADPHWTGTYRMINWRHQILGFLEYPLAVLSVYPEDGKLWCKPLMSSRRLELVPVGGNRYRLPGQSEASLVFFEDRDGNRVLAAPMLYSVEVGKLRGYGPAIVLGLAVQLMRSAFFVLALYPVWRLLGLVRRRRDLLVLLRPLAAVVCLQLSLGLLAAGGGDLGTANWRTVGSWLLSWAFAVLSVLGLWHALFGDTRGARPWLRIHAALVSLACCGVAVYLWWWGILGLRTWAW